MSIAAGLVACLSVGAVVGLDAGRSVDGIYTMPKAPRYEPLPAATPAPVAWDQAPAIAAPPARWKDRAGPADRAFFEDQPIADVFAVPPVRVHRPVRRRVAAAVEDVAVERDPAEPTVVTTTDTQPAVEADPTA